MTNFLLIHGGFHGAWCWERLVPELEALGHAAYAIDLPGHGADQTVRGTVTVSSYRARVKEFMDKHPDQSFTVVGHSLAGVTLPHVFQDSPEQVEELVFLAALVLNKGECAIGLIPEERRPSYYVLAEESSDNTLSFNPHTSRQVFYGDFTREEGESFVSKLTPQPFQIYLEEAVVSPCDQDVLKRYILCTRDATLPPDQCRAWAKKLAVPISEIDSGHSVMLEKPSELAELLVSKGPQ